MNVGQLVESAFLLASSTHLELKKEWISVSHRIGSEMADSLLSSNIQTNGEVDLVLRCLENEADEFALHQTSNSLMYLHYQKIISEYWICSMYEAFRSLRQRRPDTWTGDRIGILRDLELVRIPLNKHELAGDGSLKLPIHLQRIPPSETDSDNYVYDPKNPLRAHIMPSGVGKSGSIMWQVIDLKTETSRWIERLDISNRILSL